MVTTNALKATKTQTATWISTVKLELKFHSREVERPKANTERERERENP